MRLLPLLLLTSCEAFLNGGKDDRDPIGLVPDDALAFEDVSEAAGIVDRGSSYGTGWGDVNGDGWPDLWIGNHADGASLYLNQGDGTFLEVADSWVGDQRKYDAHGVLWADLDNDGRDELVESVGSQQGTGAGSNRLYRPVGEQLVNTAVGDGLTYAGGSGRCPVGYDWNDDGRLDVLLVNQPRADGQQPTALFTQQEDGSFVRESVIPTASEHVTPLCGQLADLDGDRVLELVRWGRPNGLSAHDAHSGTLADVSARIGVPPVNRPFDVAIGDFDNDLRNDVYVTRWEEESEIVFDEDGQGLRLAARLFGSTQGVTFRTDGDVTVRLDPPWFWGAGDIRVGGECRLISSLEHTFPSSDPANDGRCPFEVGVDRGLFVGRVDGVWSIVLATDGYDRANLIVRSTEEVTDFGTDVVSLSDDDRVSLNRDRLWLWTGAAYEDVGWTHGVRDPSTCTSAAAADFDNDGDVDVFLVCATPVENTADLMLLNDGFGRFRVADSSGAEGSTAGRGDSVAVADYDGDGFLDLFVTNGYAAPPFNDGPHQLLRNTGNRNHWLEVRLVGRGSNRDAAGASVVFTTDGVTQLREQTGGTHATAQNDSLIHVGLGVHRRVDRLDVRWPDGTTTVLEDVVADQILTIEQP